MNERTIELIDIAPKDFWGTQDAHLETIKKYYPKLIYYTSKMCNDPQKTEDIATDSFLTAFEKINKYEMEKAQFSTWLFTIAKNLALQAIKNDKKSVSLDTEYDDEGTTMKDFISEHHSDYNNHELYDSNEIKANILINHIGKLKEPYRRVIEMREIKKMSYQEISDIEMSRIYYKLFKITLSNMKLYIQNVIYNIIARVEHIDVAISDYTNIIPFTDFIFDLKIRDIRSYTNEDYILYDVGYNFPIDIYKKSLENYNN